MIGLVLIAAGRVAGEEGDGEYDAPAPYEVFLVIGEIPVWIGNEIRYTVTETVPVEARIMTASGEIIVLLKLGEKDPGQYTLPWHGAAMGAPLAGSYTFELYYGDEYAAKFPMIVAPLSAMPGAWQTSPS